MKQKDLSYYLSLQYNVVLRQLNHKYCLYIPELSLIAQGETLQAAHDALIKQKEEFFKTTIALNLEDTIFQPKSVKVKNQIFNELFLFFSKTLIVGLVLFILFLASLVPLNSLLFTQLNQGKYAVKEVITHLDEKMKVVTDAERHEKFRQRLGVVKPYFDDVRTVLLSPPQGPGAERSKGDPGRAKR